MDNIIRQNINILYNRNKEKVEQETRKFLNIKKRENSNDFNSLNEDIKIEILKKMIENNEISLFH